MSVFAKGKDMEVSALPLLGTNNSAISSNSKVLGIHG
jgi:hypothetical protein